MFENIDGWAVLGGLIFAGFFGVVVNHVVTRNERRAVRQENDYLDWLERQLA
jgi:hypothetical protein